jgi:hypothetical protein
MNARGTKLIVDLFMDSTVVLSSPYFNMMYDIFMGQDVKPLTTKEFGMVSDLFFRFGKEKKMQVKDVKLVFDLFFSKTQVINTPDFNLLYDIFMG